MIIKPYHQLDLLRKRRTATKNTKQTYSQIKRLQRIGFSLGILISSIGLSLCAWTSFETYKRIKYKEKLVIEAKQYQLLKAKYNEIITNLKSIYKVNNQISQGVVGTKSSSAFLLELQDILPTTIQLTKIKSNDKDLTIEGRSKQPLALSSINSLELQLSSSFLIENKSVFLSKAKQSGSNQNKYLTFTLKSKYSNPKTKSLIANYQRLGSLGLLKRVNLLVEEGLIK